MIYVYILYSKLIDKYYIGQSQNPWERLTEHNNNSTDSYTGKTKDWVLKAVFEVNENRADALRIEKFIKKQKSRNLIERLIDYNFTPTGELALLVRISNERY